MAAHTMTAHGRAKVAVLNITDTADGSLALVRYGCFQTWVPVADITFTCESCGDSAGRAQLCDECMPSYPVPVR